MDRKLDKRTKKAADRESVVRILQKRDLEYQTRIQEIQAKRKQLRTTLRDFEAGRLSASELGSSLRW